jgi:imidazolonepropionase-like amidohydrolase
MTLVVRGASVIDGTGADPARAEVACDGGRIRGVGRTEPARSDAVVDADGLHVLPGLSDAHTHLGLVDLSAAAWTPVAVVAGQIFRNCELALDAGFTTVRDCGGVDGGLARTFRPASCSW